MLAGGLELALAGEGVGQVVMRFGQFGLEAERLRVQAMASLVLAQLHQGETQRALGRGHAGIRLQGRLAGRDGLGGFLLLDERHRQALPGVSAVGLDSQRRSKGALGFLRLAAGA